MGPSPPPREKKCLRKPLLRYPRSNSTNSTRWRGWNSNILTSRFGKPSGFTIHILQSWLSEATTDHTTNVKTARLTAHFGLLPRASSPHHPTPCRAFRALFRRKRASPPPLAVACLSSLAITFPQASQMILWIRDRQGSHSKCSREGLEIMPHSTCTSCQVYFGINSNTHHVQW